VAAIVISITGHRAWVEGKGAFVFLLFGAHCHCSLRVNSSHHREWADALWKGPSGLCRANVRRFDVLLGQSWHLKLSKELRFTSLSMSIFSETRTQEGEVQRKLQCGWDSLGKVAQGMQGAGSPNINCPL
jgi:hypothetical protein